MKFKHKLTLLIGCLAMIHISSFAQLDTKVLIQDVVKELSDDTYKGREVGSVENEKAAKYLADIYKSVGLMPVIGKSYLVPFQYKGKTVYNVVGMIKGEEDSFYALGAHFDHIGIDENGPDTVFNGADDNASGVASMLAVASYFKTNPPRKSILIMAFNAEEVGLKGSTALVRMDEMKPILQKILVLFNMEMVGTVAASGRGTMFMTGDNQSNLYDLLKKYATHNFKVVKDPYLSEGLFFRSDNVGFYKKGIVAHSFSTCDMENTHHYHQKNDEINLIDFDNLFQISEGLAQTLSQMMQVKNLVFINK